MSFREIVSFLLSSLVAHHFNTSHNSFKVDGESENESNCKKNLGENVPCEIKTHFKFIYVFLSPGHGTMFHLSEHCL